MEKLLKETKDNVAKMLGVDAEKITYVKLTIEGDESGIAIMVDNSIRVEIVDDTAVLDAFQKSDDKLANTVEGALRKNDYHVVLF